MTSNNTPKTRTVKFETAVTRGLAAIKTQTKTQWTIGDLALTIDTTVYGSGTVQKFSDEIGMPYKTVMDLRKVASRYAASERSDLNSHSIHQIFAGQEDRAKLVKAQKWTASAARELLASRKPAGEGSEGSEDSDNGNAATDTDPRIKLVANVDRLRAELAKAEAALAAYDAEHGTPAAKASTAKPAAKASTAKPAAKASTAKPAAKATAPERHVVKGIPAHDATDTRTDCPRCTTAAQLSIPAKSVRHARRTVKAGV
jgi:hypothetical protein